MGLPVATALFGLGAGIGLIALLSHPIDMSTSPVELALMVGLGVGIDYALFVVTRFRSAYRREPRQVEAAIEPPWTPPVGRSSLPAAPWCCPARALCARRQHALRPAIAASLAVALVLAASLTLLPVLLRFTGRRVGRLRGRRHANVSRRRASGFAGGPHPAPSCGGGRRGHGASARPASPALGLRLGQSDAGNDPTSFTTRRAYDLLASGFGAGFNGPLVVAVRLPGAGKTAGSRASRARSDTPRSRLGRDATASTRPATPPSSWSIRRPRPRASKRRISSSTFAAPSSRRSPGRPGTAIHVDGATAAQVDFAHVLSGKLPLFVIVVVGLSAVLLLLIFRSLLIPLQAALMNLLSFAAALGVVVAIFQRGWLGSLIGVQPGPITPIIPVMVFAIVFGLSMDYEVFLVSRIHEEWRRRGDASAAVREGVGHTGRVITAAAAVMIAVFASVALGSGRELKLVGIALAAAIFLDAVVIRSVLLPAVLELLGRRTWSFPRWLDRRLPRLAIEPAAEPARLQDKGTREAPEGSGLGATES